MATSSYNIDISGSNETTNLICSLCETELSNLSECLSTGCNHTFHRDCISRCLNNSNECPICKKLCHVRDLTVPGSQAMNRTKNKSHSHNTFSTNNRGRGYTSTVRNTQNYTMPFNFPDMSTIPPPYSLNNGYDPRRTTFNPQYPPNFQNVGFPIDMNKFSRPYASSNTAANIDYEHISKLIDTSVNRALSNLNIQPQFSQQQEPQLNIGHHAVVSEPHTYNQPRISESFLNSSKITTMIQSWNVRFDGSSKGLRCDEFIYRIECLTRENFNNNFEGICRNLHILLNGKAKEWYWRYHKTVHLIEWQPFCAALKYEYNDYRTSFDIREEVHNRKQKPNEPFETFYDATNEILAQLSSPLPESEVIEIIIRNLRPEIRHELLYIKIESLAKLKELCLRREKLLNEEVYKRSQSFRSFPLRKIALVDGDNCYDKPGEDINVSTVDPTSHAVHAITKPEKVITCWNCDESGHYWDMCLKDRNIFCYGCGLKNVYKPQCQICSKNLKNPRGVSSNLPLHRN